MKAIIVGLVAVAFCVTAVLVALQNPRISGWLKSSYIVWDRAEQVRAPRLLTAVDVQIEDLAAIASAMSQSSAEVRYATLAFCPPECRSDDDGLNVQLSVENGRIGMDWVLLGPRNIRDREKFIAFAETEGFAPIPKAENDVSFLRVESEKAVELVVAVVTELYELPANEALSLYHEGFDWP